MILLDQSPRAEEEHLEVVREAGPRVSIPSTNIEMLPQQGLPELGQPKHRKEEPLSIESPIRRNRAVSVYLKQVKNETDILQAYHGTPIEAWLRYYNLGDGAQSYDSAQLLIVTCMDFRIHLPIPEKLAYVLRLAGANLRFRKFDLACALSFAQIRHVCLVAHTHCAMELLEARRDSFAQGLQKIAGWHYTTAAQYFDSHVPDFTLSHSAEFVLCESTWLEARFPGVQAAPLLYDTDDHVLYQILRRE